jgi:hypothetical protein
VTFSAQPSSLVTSDFSSTGSFAPSGRMSIDSVARAQPSLSTALIGCPGWAVTGIMNSIMNLGKSMRPAPRRSLSLKSREVFFSSGAEIAPRTIAWSCARVTRPGLSSSHSCW